jgi:hypothetical protein
MIATPIFPGILSGGALPLASVGYRKTIFIVLGGTGVADVTYICLKTEADVYAWTPLTYQAPTAGNAVQEDGTAWLQEDGTPVNQEG